MTNKEAWNVIECIITDIVGEFADKEMPKGAKHTKEALEKAENALEKQSAKKPNTFGKKGYSICPSCGILLVKGCGCHNNDCCQRIDWEGVE